MGSNPIVQFFNSELNFLLLIVEQLCTSVQFPAHEPIDDSPVVRNKVDKSVQKSCERKRGRPKKFSRSMRRDAANARERKRMNQLTTALMTLKHALPKKDVIRSKKQIIVEVILFSSHRKYF